MLRRTRPHRYLALGLLLAGERCASPWAPVALT